MRNILTWPHSPLLRRISAPVTFFTGWSFFVVCLSHLLAFPPLTLAMHSLVGTALGLLLVFRTNTANDRHWEGRKMWEKVVAATREIAALCAAFSGQLGNERLRRIAYLLSAFPICLRQHVCGRYVSELTRRDRELPLWRVLPARDLALVQASVSPPTRVAQLLLAETTRIADSPDGFFSNRERCALSGMVSKLLGTVAQCERLVQTPIPQSYVRHTSRFLSLWLVTLPFALCYIVGWWTPLVVWMASWSLCGIQELGQVIEHPFDGPQSLSLSVMSETVHTAMTDTLLTVASQNASGLLRQILLQRLPAGRGSLHALSDEELGATDDVLGRTALHHAAYLGDVSAIERLLLAGANVNASDSWDGSTPLDVALTRNHLDAAAAIQERGGRSAVLSAPERGQGP
uniref:Bestrophin homolog n=1 Tax=Alexandrium catenella TaxID=2925 RepID=A0A7S1PTC6_ALECA|mmetsp:Transcript_110397/g.293247  ORF Transcript_110397/g.293247 Transcript_110397/m.293247 type:complete len:403 (+) Transcript_110397:209-1417(+)